MKFDDEKDDKHFILLKIYDKLAQIRLAIDPINEQNVLTFTVAEFINKICLIKEHTATQILQTVETFRKKGAEIKGEW